MSIAAEFIKRRDEASFRALYRQHTPMIFGMAMRLSASRASAEELVQEAWVRAVERIDQFRSRSRFSTWLGGILINCHRERMRRQARFVATPPPDPGAEVIDVFAGRHAASADPTDVDRALGKLADGYREVVLLHDLYGYTHAEIAAMLGIEVGTSKSQLARGRAQLRRVLSAVPAAGGANGGNRAR